MLGQLLHGPYRVLLKATSGPTDHFLDEVLKACRGNAMMGLVYVWVRVQAGIDHDPVDEVVHHCGDAVNAAEPFVEAGMIGDSHLLLLPVSPADEVDIIGRF